MFIVSMIVVYLGILAVSDKLWGNPLAFIGVGYLAFCVTMLGGVVLKAISLSI